jgi:hypothetical protein
VFDLGQVLATAPTTPPTRTVPRGGSAERIAREARADVARLAHALAAPAGPGTPVR